ncbi:MAG: efflux transporter, family, subunit [Myxococcales bacterium]|nr:efflux transporter, family, subunit [Myxococcales bacterium]
MIRSVAWLLVPVALVASCAKSEDHKSEQWTCPMHPQYVSDKPGDCPICNMQLVPKKSTTAAAPSAERKVLFYRNPMNPADTSPTPKKDQMGMDYVPVYAEQAGGAIDIDAERQRLMGLKMVEVKMAPLSGGIRTTGRITVDERRVEKVTARFDGYVEKLYADFTGKLVSKGDPLVSVYSPDLLATAEEYLLAIRARATLAESGLPDAARAARDRLELYGISDGEIDRLAKRGSAERAMTLRAPISGFVTTKSVVAGSRVQPNDALFEIVDLSRVWVLADVYENELPRLKLGQKATLTLSYWPDRKWTGTVSYILPTVDDKTRTVKVRIEIANPRNELKPEMFGDVVLDTSPRQALVVPEDAVIETGARKLVFVAVGDGKLQPRPVEVGAHLEGVYEVKSGLTAGEKVATGASFLLDSEARLRSAPGGSPSPLDGSAP